MKIGSTVSQIRQKVTQYYSFHATAQETVILHCRSNAAFADKLEFGKNTITT